MTDLRARVLRELEAPAQLLAAEFFDAEGRFAALTFDALPDNPVGRFSAADLLAVSLLEPLKPPAVRALLTTRSGEFTELLQELPADVDLWDATDTHLAAAERCDVALRSLRDVGETRASKLMARKRPRLVPIVDSVIRHALSLGGEPRRELRECLADPEVRAAVERARPQVAPAEIISTLRLLDAVVWIRHSGSRNAQEARRRAGLEE
ncbi:DUF6308 family protein [Mycolicibacterium goodii]|uniref:Uncharacterized protein n=1 Tax=Mycolicibacterium goodii TaxID=134601 RepID=A0ABS6HY32_MYCGD|nr:DUF6308 family protein [Mycolicibacterium goodii]MBU8827475.1 hypothetical protein [Mycolicibacterium goodii]MBU8841610.1 hypothetical protein [Mycolicibacterium goodii]